MNKKGFTLIELLAVIVILAIIALITTPLILRVVENTFENPYSGATTNVYDDQNYGYWTLSPASGSTTDVWHVRSGGTLYYANIVTFTDYGVRPVITIPKSVLN